MDDQKTVSSNTVFTERPRFMFMSKILLAATALVLYVMQFLIFIPLIGIMKSIKTFDLKMTPVFILLGVAIVLGLASFALAIVGGVKNEGPFSLITVIVKACMIPFFGINLYCWLTGISGMLNPFLLMGIPFVGFLGICLTYVFMFTTSAPDIVYTIIFCIRNRKRPTGLMIAGVILEFFFLADLVGAILLHKTYKDITVQDSIR